jgi:hypothetical protein
MHSLLSLSPSSTLLESQFVGTPPFPLFLAAGLPIVVVYFSGLILRPLGRPFQVGGIQRLALKELVSASQTGPPACPDAVLWIV